uniref:Uncharacterized protein n=1 Tax=Romanomermis culicivorax TaxID=13658 RepID=A0A915IC12_ROMCU
MDEWMWQGSRKAWPVAFQQMMPGLMIGAADAISLDGITMLVMEVSSQRNREVTGGGLGVGGLHAAAVVAVVEINCCICSARAVKRVFVDFTCSWISP